MSAVWKYPLTVIDYIDIAMPDHAVILTLQMQYGVPCLWTLVDPDAPKVTRSFRIFGTGHPCPFKWDDTSWAYIGSFQMNDGALVFHVFEVTP